MDPVTLGLIGQAASAATPFVSRALQGLFGIESAEDKQRKAIEASMAPYAAVAQGGTTQAQAGAAYARGRALQELQGQAARGTAQQQAGLQREALRVGQDVQAQYAAQLADIRSREQERARMGVAMGQSQLAKLAAEEADRKRAELAGFVTGVGGLAAKLGIGGSGTVAPTATGIPVEQVAAYNAAPEATRRMAYGSALEPMSATGDFGAAFAQRSAELQAQGRAKMGKEAIDVLGLDPNRPVGGLGSTSRASRGVPVTDYERSLDPAQQVANLREQRTLATANVAPGSVAPGQYDYTAGMSKGTGEFASLADRQATMNQMAPYMKSQVGQAPAPSLAPVVTPFSNQGAQMDILRAARPGRMPRKMSRTPGGGGLGL